HQPARVSVRSGLMLCRRWLPLARRCRWSSTSTEIEHRDDGAFKRYVPGPKTGGFARGSFIAWRRHERVRESALSVDSIQELYDFQEVVGEGGFGTVHRARHRRTGEFVAIKSIGKSKLEDEEMLQLEVEFLKLSDHPNTVRYYETLEDASDIHLVMEMCSGGSLSEYIQTAHDSYGPGVSEDELCRITVQMLQGVAYCHAHAVAHRDIKPQNLLFSCGKPGKGSAIPIACSGHGDAPLKLVDFGIAGVCRTDRPEKRLLTKCAGTLGYMAPEVFGSRPYDGRSADIFSIGAVMHHMIVGVPPSWQSKPTTSRGKCGTSSSQKIVSRCSSICCMKSLRCGLQLPRHCSTPGSSRPRVIPLTGRSSPCWRGASGECTTFASDPSCRRQSCTAWWPSRRFTTTTWSSCALLFFLQIEAGAPEVRPPKFGTLSPI
ncbi:unnamed protein product, partial [Effrenium voratum]